MPDKRPFTSPFTGPQTEDRYFCRDCRHVGHADEVGDAITCELCDSPDLVHELVRRDEIRADAEEQMRRDDRIAEYRRTHARTPSWANGFAKFEERVKAIGTPVTEGAMLRRQAAA